MPLGRLRFGALFLACLFIAACGGGGNDDSSGIAHLKIVQASPATGPVNVLMDGTSILQNFEYKSTSAYQNVAVGAHTITFQSIVLGSTLPISAQPLLSPATDTSIVLTGATGDWSAIVLADDNASGAPGFARVRFVNVATTVPGAPQNPNVGSVDIYVDNSPIATNVVHNGASSYVALRPATYAINFKSAGQATVFLALPAVPISADHTYSIFLVGPPGVLDAVITVDN